MAVVGTHVSIDPLPITSGKQAVEFTWTGPYEQDLVVFRSSHVVCPRQSSHFHIFRTAPSSRARMVTLAVIALVIMDGPGRL